MEYQRTGLGINSPTPDLFRDKLGVFRTCACLPVSLGSPQPFLLQISSYPKDFRRASQANYSHFHKNTPAGFQPLIFSPKKHPPPKQKPTLGSLIAPPFNRNPYRLKGLLSSILIVKSYSASSRKPSNGAGAYSCTPHKPIRRPVTPWRN